MRNKKKIGEERERERENRLEVLTIFILFFARKKK